MSQILVLQQAILDDGTGTAHPDAVYLPTNVVMDLIDGLGSVTWLPYHNAAALLAGEKGLSQCQITQQLDAKAFAADCAFAIPAGPFAGAVSQSLVYVAKLVQDVDTGQKDATDQHGLVSFFASATVTQIGA